MTRSACSTWCYVGLVTESISQRELRNDSGRIMRGLSEGKSFVINSHGRPVGELRPLRRERLVDAATVAAAFASAPRIDGEAFRRDIDAHIDQDSDPRA